MRHLALATDYDGTLAEDGHVRRRTADALRRLRASGRRVVLVTGRTLDDVRRVFPASRRLDAVVAENGATLWTPARGERALAEAPPPHLVARLRERCVPLTAGRVIVATLAPHQRALLATLRELGLERHLVLNKGAVMALPPGVDKGSGLAAALAQLGLVRDQVVAVGDAENDEALLAAADVGVAVANALPALKARADLVTARARGAGVEELVARLLVDDLASLDARGSSLRREPDVRPKRSPP